MCRTLFYLISFVVVLSLVYPASAQPTGHILFEYWFDIGGTAVSDLISQPAYPGSPDESEWRQRYEGPVDWRDNYGSRARGYLYPPADGDYTFWISGDDNVELFLSTDDDPANAVLIAEVPGWSQHLEWGKYPEQQSAPITLVGRQKYYIESIMKEAGGGDSMTVAWAGPGVGDELKIIDSAYLSPLIRANDPLRPIYSKANIILVSGTHDFDADGIVDDFMLRDILVAAGHTVDYRPGNWTELDDDKIAALNSADLVIISRCSDSGDYDDGDEVAQWNSITTPMLNSSAYLLRSSRWKWVDSTSILNLAPAVMELADGTQIDALDEFVGQSSFIDASPGNGTVLARGDGLPWIIEWDTGVEYYAGSGQAAGGPRVFFAAGTQNVEGVSNWGEWNLTPAGLDVYLDTVYRLLAAVEKDITRPGDIVKGVPDDGDWPGNEHPASAIDGIVNTKYLHFKGDFNPDPGTGGSGLQITPLKGPSVVTGLTLTTANDVPGRDPVAFELSGSNESIDGPYELIASGDIVDFAGAAAWPRFTKNETPISFYNDVEYTHYQIIFTAIRGPVGGSVNSMQIAEVELLEIGPIDRVVDNFGLYNDLDEGESGSNRIFNTWIDGFDDPTNGAIIDLVVTPFNEQLMYFSYDNTDNVHYSEAYRTFVTPKDWTDFNVVSFYMRGNPDNNLAPVYVRLRDNQGTESVVYSPDSNALVTDEWNELSFPLAEFQNMDVSLAEIKEVACGVGIHPKALIYDVSTGFISNPPSIGLLQADNCGYCSSYGQADIDDWALTCKTWAEKYWYSGCLLTGCVFHESATQGKAMVTLGTLSTITCPDAGRYIIFPSRNKYYNVTVRDQFGYGDVIYSDSISDTELQTGLNVMNFGSP